MKDNLLIIAVLTSMFLYQGCTDKAVHKVPAEAAQSSNEFIPGPRTCFWSRGPVSKDPYINIAYPDANAFYWNALFTVPDGAHLHFEEIGREKEIMGTYLPISFYVTKGAFEVLFHCKNDFL